MLAAETARKLASAPSLLSKIDKKIRLASEKGEPGIWVDSFPYNVSEVLGKLGYETTIGSGKDDTGVDRSGMMWIWWGN